MDATGEVTDRTTLYKKLAAVMGEIARVSKDGTNAKQNYKYATESDISDMVRSKLAAQNVAFLVDMEEPEPIAIESSSGSKGFHYRIKFLFTFACGDTGATITQTWYGEAQDWGDKGISKASTLAAKYFLIRTFIMSTGESKDDPDSGEGSQEVAERRAESRRQPPASKSDAEWVNDDERWNALVKKAREELWDGIPLPHARNRVMAALNVEGGWDQRATFGGTQKQAWALVKAYVPSEAQEIADELGGEVTESASQDPLFPAAQHRAESDGK